MAAISFESVASTFTILSPQNNFAAEIHQVEVRKDPLLRDTSVYNPFLKDKAKAFFGDTDQDLIRRLVEESAKTCIFCEGRVELVTPKYPADLVPEGRIKAGESLLFPNLFSVGAWHAVVALSRAHYLTLSEFTPFLIENGLKALREFLHAVFRRDQSANFVTVNANYLFPAGASLVHPHLQMLVTPIAYSYHARLIDGCRRYFREYGRPYHADLIAEEKKGGARYIAESGGWHWLTAYSPIGSNEVMAVHEEESDLSLLPDSDLRELAQGISRVLAYYERLGYLSFNFTLFAARRSREEESSRCLLKIINRQNLYPNYRNDDYFLQKMLQTELIINLPEDLAAKLRASF